MKQLTADSNECWKRGNRWRRLVEEKDQINTSQYKALVRFQREVRSIKSDRAEILENNTMAIWKASRTTD